MSGQPNTKDKRYKRSEKELVHYIADFLRENAYHVRFEVPNMGQSTDIVATKGRWVTSIEVKTSDWKRAMKQCRAHEAVADYVCIGIGNGKVPIALLDEARRAGYGVLHCAPGTHQCRWALKPRLNKKLWMPQRRKWSETFGAIDYEC